MSGNALQRCLEKQIAGRVTLLIRTRWHRPIHLCLLFDVWERAGHRDGLFHWRLVWWIKHQWALRQDWIFEYKRRNCALWITGQPPLEKTFLKTVSCSRCFPKTSGGTRHGDVFVIRLQFSLECTQCRARPYSVSPLWSVSHAYLELKKKKRSLILLPNAICFWKCFPADKQWVMLMKPS